MNIEETIGRYGYEPRLDESVWLPILKKEYSKFENMTVKKVFTMSTGYIKKNAKNVVNLQGDGRMLNFVNSALGTKYKKFDDIMSKKSIQLVDNAITVGDMMNSMHYTLSMVGSVVAGLAGMIVAATAAGAMSSVGSAVVIYAIHIVIAAVISKYMWILGKGVVRGVMGTA